ncbi:unnamed protein product [Trichobilharzia regenti]|nr:unnamed protein product [Trichobilharzia regenti]
MRPDVVNNQTVDTIKMTNSRRKSSNPKDNLSNNTDMSQRNGNTIEEGSVVEQPGDVDNDNDDDEEDVDVNFKPKQISQEVNRLFCVKITARSSTKIFAISCLRVLISSCAKLCNASLLTENYQSNQISVNTYDETSDVIVNPSSIAHFDLAKARALRSQSGKSDWLILYLSDLIRIAFMSATSESDRLRITGLKLMQDVVQRFSPVPDPDYPDHIILEQYQAQVSAALRPAFISTSSLDLSENTTITESSTPNISTSSSIVQSNPELLSIACQVCSSWITSGVGPAWAEIYIVTAGQAKKLGGKLHQKQHLETSQSQPLDEDQPIDESDEMNTSENEDESDYSIIIKGISLEDMLSTATTSATTTTPSRSIHQLLTKWIQPILPGLSQAWLSALRDYAYMCLPDSLSNQQQQQQSSDIRVYYARYWPCMTYALALWLTNESSSFVDENKTNSKNDMSKSSRHFFLILGK